MQIDTNSVFENKVLNILETRVKLGKRDNHKKVLQSVTLYQESRIMSNLTSSYFEKFEYLFDENGITEQYANLSDFTIISRDGEEIPTFKLLLAFQGKYFEALFRHEPEIRQVQLQFEDCYLRRIFHLPFDTEWDTFGDTELLKLLEITEYLNMEELSELIQETLGQNLNLENIEEISNFAMNFAILPQFKNNLGLFLRQNILHLNLTKIPKDLFKEILIVSNSKCPHVKDQHGRYFDIVRSELKIFQLLFKMQDIKDIISEHEISRDTLDRLQYAMAHQNQFQLSEDDIRSLCSFLKCDMPNQVPEIEQNVYRKEFKTIKKKVLQMSPFVDLNSRFEEWSLFGTIRKVQVKCRRLYSCNDLVGFTIETYEGNSLSVLMEDQKIEEDFEIKEFTVPNGQHIRDVLTFSSDYYFDYLTQLIFMTSEGVKFQISDKIDVDITNCASSSKSKHYSLSGISGKTIRMMFGDSEDRIGELVFHFDTIDTSSICSNEGTIYCKNESFEPNNIVRHWVNFADPDLDVEDFENFEEEQQN